MNLYNQFTQALATKLPHILHNVLTDSTTLGELREIIASNPQVSALPLSTLVKSRKQPATKRAAGHLRASPSKVNARTAEGRAKLDVAVLDAITKLGGEDIAASVIKVGANAGQLRDSLARLIEAELVTWSGKARGTRYHLAE